MRLYGYERERLSVSAFGKFENCAAAYILSTHYKLKDGLESEALKNGIAVHKEFESVDVIYGYRVLAHEKRIDVEDDRVGKWMGYIDAVCADDDNGKFVLDIKTGRAKAVPSWARGYLLSLQGSLYTLAEGVEIFAVYHPRDEMLFFTHLNPSISRHRLLQAYRKFMRWQLAGQPYSCKPRWNCRWCDFNGSCERLMSGDLNLPPTLELKTQEK